MSILMRKDLLVYLFYFVIGAGASGLLLYEDGMDSSVVLMLGSMMMMSVFVSIALNENIESSYNGYKFLRILPVTAAEIVTAKFLLALIFTLLYFLYASLLLLFFSKTAEFLVLSRGYIVLNAIVGLIISALLYNGIYRYGFTKFFKVVCFTLPIAAIFVPGLVKIAYRQQLRSMNAEPLIKLTAGPNLLLFGAAALILYVVLMRTAINKKKNFKEV